VPIAKAKGIDISYNIEGRGEPLIMMMGFAVGGRSWIFERHAFKKYYRLITFDTKRVRKAHKPEGSYTTKTMADDVIALMDYLKIDQSHILGVSMGGMIAQEVAINYPERIKKLILVSTFGGQSGMTEAPLDLLKSLGLKENYSEEETRRIDIERLIKSLASLSFNEKLHKMIFGPLANIQTKSGGAKNIVGQFQAALGHNAVDRLHMIKASTLVLAGTADKIVPPGSAEVLAGRIPDAKLVKFQGGPHAIHLEMSSRFDREILDFLRDS